MDSVRFLTLAEVQSIHRDQITRCGGDYQARDLSLVSPSFFFPHSSFDGQYLHHDLFKMAAAYAVHIRQNHALPDGNKGVGIVYVLILPYLIGVMWHRDVQ